MILILLFLSIFFLFKPALVNGFTYQFVLENNIVDLDFVKVKTLENPQAEIPESNNILSFDYRLETKESYPANIPLFIVAFDKEVVFYADSSFIEAEPHTVKINMQNFSTYSDQMPVFYKNNFIDGFNLDISNVNFINQSADNESSIKINDLNVIREKDGSLTVVFFVQEEFKSQHSYQLFCLNEKQEIINSIKLSKKDNFLWPEHYFINLFANQNSELIFNLEEFTCIGELYVATENGSKSNKTSIIGIENL